MSDKSKVLCKYFVSGVCRFGAECDFSHDLEDLQNQVCKYYLAGCCWYGDRCRYEHKRPDWWRTARAAAAPPPRGEQQRSQPLQPPQQQQQRSQQEPQQPQRQAGAGTAVQHSAVNNGGGSVTAAAASAAAAASGMSSSTRVATAGVNPYASAWEPPSGPSGPQLPQLPRSLSDDTAAATAGGGGAADASAATAGPSGRRGEAAVAAAGPWEAAVAQADGYDEYGGGDDRGVYDNAGYYYGHGEPGDEYYDAGGDGGGHGHGDGDGEEYGDDDEGGGGGGGGGGEGGGGGGALVMVDDDLGLERERAAAARVAAATRGDTRRSATTLFGGAADLPPTSRWSAVRHPWEAGAEAGVGTEAGTAGSTADPEDPAGVDLCPGYALHGRCAEGEECSLIHGLECEICHKFRIHPYNAESADEHRATCRLRHERLEARLRSAAVECGICLEPVLEKASVSDRRFGLLACDHSFCLSCIRAWRGRTDDASLATDTAVRTCPICRTRSHFVTPSLVWPASAEEKAAIVAAYRARLAAIDCKHFDFGDGTCPFSTSCFYRHMYRDGRLEEPQLRRAGNADGDVRVVVPVRLSAFFDTPQAQRLLGRRR